MMDYTIGDIVKVRINKIQENGCFCSFLTESQNKFGFLPKKLMLSYLDREGRISNKVGDVIIVVISSITDKGIILSDESSYKVQKQINDFVSKYDEGTVFEAEVVRVETKKVYIKLGNIVGVILKEDTNWNEIDQLKEILFEGEIIHVVYLKYDKGHLFFSTKYLNAKPYDENLYELSLSELLCHIGHKSDVFIGKVKQSGNYAFIENLYSCDETQKGQLLIDPAYGYNLKAVIINQFDRKVNEGEFYKVKITKLVDKVKRKERSQLYQFAAEIIERVENPFKTDVKIAFQRNTTNPSGNQRDAKLLDEIGKNMYSSKDRMFFELVQNADDAASKNGVLINVKSEGDFLIVRHNGFSFDKNDFDSITTAANGTKKANENKTGYKGIGFKSVFTDSEQVFISTGGYQFKFDREEPIFLDFDRFYLDNNPMIINDESKHRFLELYGDYKKQFNGIHSIPWQLEPIWVDVFPEQLGDDFVRSNVSIALRLGANKIEGKDGYSQAIKGIIDDPKFMLFLRNTKRIDFNGKTVSKVIKDNIIILKNSFGEKHIEYFKRKDYEVEVNNRVFEENGINIRIQIEKKDDISGKVVEAKFVDAHNQELENVPPKIAISNSTCLSFAVPIAEDGSLNPNTQFNGVSLYAYLPTLVKDFKFPFYINANFILDPPRQRILGDNPWNFYLMQEIARYMVRWCALLNERQDKNALNVLVAQYFEEESADTKRLAEHFNNSYKKALESEPFILNHKNKLSRQNEIVVDETGFSDVVGPDLFLHLLKTEKKLPSKKIDSKILSKKIFEAIEKIEYDGVISAITDNPEFNQWFVSATDELKEKLYNWIVKHNSDSRESKIKEFVNNLPLYENHSFAEIEHNNGCIEENRTINECYENAMADDECDENEKEFIRCHLENLGESFLDDYYTGVYRSSEYGIIITNHTAAIKDILQDIGFRCFDNDVNDGHPLYPFINKQDEAKLFDIIKGYDFSSLDEEKRKRLFLSLKSFNGVGPAALKGLPLFRNANGIPKPLSEMMRYTPNMPSYVFPYMLSEDDYSSDLTEYIIDDGRVFDDVMWKHKDDFGVAITKLYSTWKWSDEKYTKELIEQYKKDDKLSSLLPIIEDSRPETKKYYLDSIERIDLQSEIRYTRLSWQYRVLQMAVSVYDDPTCFSAKIFFDGQCINSLSVSNEVTCYYGPKEKGQPVKFSLAKLLPQYKIQSDAIGKFKSAFEEEKNLDKFLVVKEIPLSSIVKRLEDKDYLGLTYGEWKYEKGGNAHQYLFYVYYYRHIKGWISNYVIHIKLENESDAFIRELMDFLYDNKIDIKTSPFTFRIHQYFTGKYFDSDYIFDTEQLLPAIERWCDGTEKKKDYLYANGVGKDTDYKIKFRQLFLKNEAIDFIEQMTDADVASSIRFVAQANGYIRPFCGDNQRIVLLSIKDKKISNLTSKWNLEKINQESKEWDSKEYAQWIKNHHPNIFLYPGKLPNRLLYTYPKEEFLLDYEDADTAYYYEKNSSRLFVNGENDIYNLLLKIVQDKDIPFTIESFRLLCMEGKVPISKDELEEKNRRITELEEKVRLYEMRLGTIVNDNEDEKVSVVRYSSVARDVEEESGNCFRDNKKTYKEAERKQFEQSIRDFLGGSFNLDQYNTKSEHIISCYRILKYLEGQGEQFAPDFDQKQFVNSDDYQQIKLQDGICVNPSSAKWGVWYIHPNVWRDIVINGNWACVCTGNGENDFILIKSEEDLEHIANTGESIIMKMSTSDNHNVFEVTNTVFPGVGNESMDIHLMIKLHDTPNEVDNSLFDKAFASAQNDFTI